MKTRLFRSAVLIALIMAAALAPGSKHAGAATQIKTLGVEPGNLAPEFSFRNAQGKWISLSDFRGKKVFLFSWSTWCTCKEQLPDLEKFYEKYKSPKFVVIAVASDAQGFKWVKSYLDKAHATFIALVDPENDLARKYNFSMTENGFLIDEAGVIRMNSIGFDIRKTKDRDELVRLMKTDFKAQPGKGQQESLAKRIQALETSIAANPQAFKEQLDVSALYTQQGDLGKAETALRDALKIKKQSAEAHYRLGVVLYQKGDVDTAVAEWEKAFKYEPTNYIYMRNIEAYKTPEKFYSDLNK